MKSYVVAALSAALGFGPIAASHAATLNMDVTADNQFDVYVSSSDSVLGTLVLSGNAWGTTYSASVTVPGGADFIHVIAINWTSDNGYSYGSGTPPSGGNPGAFIGTFSISGGAFSNGATALSTDTTHWTANPATPAGSPPWSPTDLPGWAAPTGAPVSYGLNGVAPWGDVQSVSSSAQWLWPTQNPDYPYNYDYAEFSTTFIAAPEPAAWMMISLGFAALGFAAVRRSGKQALPIEG